MPIAPDLLRLRDALWLWQAYDPVVKSDLFSTAARLGGTLFLIDPIPLASPALEELLCAAPVGGVLLTNANHPRAAADFARQFEVPIFAAPEVMGELEPAHGRTVTDGEEIVPSATAIAIQGAAPGELAFHLAADGGTMVVGDALINFEPYGFSLLPPKYCSDQKEMGRSLRRLLDWSFERLLFAHGTPILASARARLETLLR